MPFDRLQPWAASVYILICPLLKRSNWNLFWTYQTQLEADCKYLEPTRATQQIPAVGCSILGMDSWLGWIFARSWGCCAGCRNSLTCCWVEPFYQYQFQMFTAVNPLRMHGWLVNNNSPQNPMLNNNWKGSGLVACARHQEMSFKPAVCKSRWDLLWGQLWVVFDLFCVRTPRSEMIYGEQKSPSVLNIT